MASCQEQQADDEQMAKPATRFRPSALPGEPGLGEEAGRCSRSENSEREMDLRRVQLTHEGMRLMLCSQVRQAEELFRMSRYLGPELNAGYSFVQLVRALMSFEDDAMDTAYKSLESTEKFCETGRKFRRIFSKNLPHQLPEEITPHEKLIRRSIIADCLLFEAVLVFVRQGFTSYVKGGYILRKAWKHYERIYHETETLCSRPSPITAPGQSSPQDRHVGSSLYDQRPNGDELVEEEAEADGAEGLTDEATIEAVGETLADLHVGLSAADTASQRGPLSRAGLSSRDGAECRPHPLTLEVANGGMVPCQLGLSSSQDNLTVDESDGQGHPRLRPGSGYLWPTDEIVSDIRNLEHEDDRLRGAVYFGYGLMNIIVSLIPPKLMKFANLFGFHGDRRVGLQALEYASNSQDMKAPLARIALLWYHTIVRPFFALDGENEGAGADEAERLLGEAQARYPESSLFLYFSGKIHYLRCELDKALEVYTSAAALAKDQQEIEHISLYEKGWIHFLQLDFAQALPCYLRLKNETRWSACYYTYLAAVMSGILGDLKGSKELFLQVSKLVKRKNNNLEKFCSRRGSSYKRGPTVFLPLETRLMAVEVLYLWRALPFCSRQAKEEMLSMLSIPMPPTATPQHRAMKAWLVGAVLNALKRTREAERSLRQVMQYEPYIKQDKHILSFTLFEMASVHISRDEFARARAALTMAKENYSGYEFEARLNFKVHSVLSRIK